MSDQSVKSGLPAPDVSIVVPVRNEQDNVAPLIAEIAAALDGRWRYEIIYVNDGSRDESLSLLRATADGDPRVTVIDLSRNHGHQLAVTAGLDAARGDAVVIMDSDLQDPPEVVLELVAKWHDGYDVAYAQRRSRKDGFFKKATADLFYRTLNVLSDIDIPRNTGDFRLISRKVLEHIRRYPEHDRFLRGMISHAGFKQIAVPFDRHARHAGETGYPLRKMLRLASDGIMGFSSQPLGLISKVGGFLSIFAFLGVLYALVIKLFFPAQAVAGWAFTVIAVLFMGGVQLVMLGIVGSYIGRIFTEVKGRPLYGIQEVYTSRREDDAPDVD